MDEFWKLTEVGADAGKGSWYFLEWLNTGQHPTFLEKRFYTVVEHQVMMAWFGEWVHYDSYRLYLRSLLESSGEWRQNDGGEGNPIFKLSPISTISLDNKWTGVSTQRLVVSSGTNVGAPV